MSIIDRFTLSPLDIEDLATLAQNAAFLASLDPKIPVVARPYYSLLEETFYVARRLFLRRLEATPPPPTAASLKG